MKPRIAILSAAHFCEYIQKLLVYYHLNLDDKCTLHYYSYETIEELPELYEGLFDKYDGFCVTGNTSLELLKTCFGGKRKPIRSISAKSAEYYKEFFFLVNQNRELDLSSVALDSYYWIGNQSSANIIDFIDEDRRLSDIQRDIVQNVSVEQILSAEKTIVEGAKKAWENQEITLVVCRFSSAFPALQKAGIPAAFVYPTSDTIVSAIDLIIRDIEEEQLREEFPAVMFLTSHNIEKDLFAENNIHILDIQKALWEFDKEYVTGFIINQVHYGFEIYTTRRIVRQITEDFKNCNLEKYIFGKTGLEVQTGYGIGQTIVKARQNALEAYALARKNRKSYLLKEDKSIVGPLNDENVMELPGEISAELQVAAQKTGLSVHTLQRVRSAVRLLETDEITTQDLASCLQVTVANANRFLNALLEAGYAEITQKKKSYSKGRPSRIYKIFL